MSDEQPKNDFVGEAPAHIVKAMYDYVYESCEDAVGLFGSFNEWWSTATVGAGWGHCTDTAAIFIVIEPHEVKAFVGAGEITHYVQLEDEEE